MYVNFSSNELHHLTVTDIVDRTDNEVPYILLKGRGKIMYRDGSSTKGFSVRQYIQRVIVKGNLMNYVLSEIDINDNILVLGWTERFYKEGYGETTCVKAECIYKEDWMKYYNDYSNINPVDGEDRL